MKPDTLIGIVFAVLGVVGGFGMLFVKVDERSIKSLSKVVPWAGMSRNPVFRYFIAGGSFVLAAIGTGLALGWISFH